MYLKLAKLCDPSAPKQLSPPAMQDINYLDHRSSKRTSREKRKQRTTPQGRLLFSMSDTYVFSQIHENNTRCVSLGRKEQWCV